MGANRRLLHIGLPLLATAAIVALYFTPLTVISCVNRGLIALGIVFASLITGIVLGLFGLRARARGEEPGLWVASMLLLLLPALLVLGPLG